MKVPKRKPLTVEHMTFKQVMKDSEGKAYWGKVTLPVRIYSSK